jgi:hypothetical protein
MARKGKKKGGRFWAWLTGREPGQPAGMPLPDAAQDQAGQALPQQPPTTPAQPQPPERSCPICGGTSFRWGWLESGLYGVGKGPAAAAQPKYVRKKTRFGDFLGLRARACEGCGHVELFTRQEEER